MNRSRLRAALLLGLALWAPPAVARAEAPARLGLWEGAMPALQLSPLTLDATKKKKKKSKKPAPKPEAEPADSPAPDLGTGAPTPAAEPAQPVAPGTADVPPAQPAPSAAPSNSSGGDMNFDLLGESKPKERSADDLQVEHRAEVRRGMLTVHQGVGLATLGLLAGTCVIGQLNYMDKFGGSSPNNTARFESAHSVLAFGTLTGFAATGILGLTAPVPYAKPVDVDTTLFHKLFMGGATLGMASELGLGVYTASHEGLQGQKSVAQLHQIIGYTTLALMGAGASAFIF